jgi:hypothetical protein
MYPIFDIFSGNPHSSVEKVFRYHNLLPDIVSSTGMIYHSVMFIAKIKTRKAKSGTYYHTYKLLSKRKVDNSGGHRQRAILNLGAGYSFPQELWTALTTRIEQLLKGMNTLLFTNPQVEQEAHRLVSEIKRRGDLSLLDPNSKTPLDGYYFEDIKSKQQRTIGVEYISLYAANKLQLPQIFSSLGFDDDQINMFLSLIIGRMAQPASEASTFNWLSTTSALGDLIGVDFSELSVMALHRACDELVKKYDEIEKQIYSTNAMNADYDTTIALYDLTNTYLEGDPDDEDAKRGFSKEKRFDCKLKSLAIMLDWSGFIRRSKIFPGNISEPKTMSIMLDALNPPTGTMMIMDRGIATAEVLDMLVERGFRYLVVNREKSRIFDDKLAKPIKTAGNDEIYIYTQLSEDGKENRLLCRSPKRAIKEQAMLETRMNKYKDRLTKLNENLTNQGQLKNWVQLTGLSAVWLKSSQESPIISK